MTFEGRSDATANLISIDTGLMSASGHNCSDPDPSGNSPLHIQLSQTSPAAFLSFWLDAKLLHSFYLHTLSQLGTLRDRW